MPQIFTIEVNEVPDLGFTVVVRDRRPQPREQRMPTRIRELTESSISPMMYDVPQERDDPNMRGFRTLAQLADYVHEQLTNEPAEPEEGNDNADSGLRNPSQG